MFENIKTDNFFSAISIKENKSTHDILETVIRSSLGNLKESESKNIPTPVVETFIALLFEKELTYARTKGTSIDENHCRKTCNKMIKALSNLYRDNQKNFSSENETSLLEMFEIDEAFFKKKLQKNESEKKQLIKAYHGKTLSEIRSSVAIKGEKALAFFDEMIDDWNNNEQVINTILAGHRAFRRLNIVELLLNTSFFDTLIENQNVSFVHFITDFFKENISDFYAYMKKPIAILSQKTSQKTSVMAFIHILQNNVFAKNIREKIDPKVWDKKLVFTLGSSALHRSTHVSEAKDFVQKIETLSEDQIKNLFVPFLSLIKKEIVDPQKEACSPHDYQKLSVLLTSVKKEKLQNVALDFFNKLPDETFFHLTKKIKEEDIQNVCQILLRTPKSRRRLLNLELENGKNMVWTAFEKKLLTSDDMNLLISEAIELNNDNFLFAKKNIKLTPQLPCYSKLCFYFSNQLQSLRFVDSFEQTSKNAESKFNQVKDFISEPKMVLKIAGLFHVIHCWARGNDNQKLLDFFFNGDVERQLNLTLKLTEEDIKNLLLKRDKEGKTPWHYFCLNRNRLFFGKNFKKLHPLFLTACHIKDNDGKSPLDYTIDDLKFRKVLAEKIPETEKLMAEAGLSLEHKKKPKEDKKEKNIEKIIEQHISKVEKKEEPVWKIQEMCHDKLRKDSEFKELLQREIDLLPHPKSGSINVANKRLQKKDVFGAPVFKIWYENKRWRVPFVKDDASGTLFIFPASDRNDTYTNQDYCRIVRNWVKWVKRQTGNTRS